MSHCPHCGQEIETGSESCSACGKSLTTPEEPSVSALVPEQIQIGEVKVGDYFKAGWELFKKYPAGFVGYFIIVIITTLVLQLVPVIGWLAGFALASPLNAGFFVVSAKLLKNQTPEFTDFFSGFKFFLQLALLGVVSSILICIGLILLIAPGVYLIVSYLFALMFIVDRGLDFWPAMETSRRSVQTRWFGIFLLFLLLLLLNLGGLLLLGVGLLVSVPLTHCIITVAYADIFGLKSAYKIAMSQ
jgi:uncharacterized membrane protein